MKKWMEDMQIDVRDIIEGIIGWGSLFALVFMASVVF